ncbi:MAG: zinc-ribbon and DUF3426 domain-containing protein [Burkholderiaceae bacterium]
MDLTTRCPQCGTTFSASMQELQLRKGYIRCVNCAHIFDGYEAVVSQSPSARKTPEPSAPDVIRQRPTPSPVAASQAASAPGHTVSLDTPLAQHRAGDPFTISAARAAGQGAARQDPVFRVDERQGPAAFESEPTLGRAPAAMEHAAGLPPIRRRDDLAAQEQIYAEPRYRASGQEPPAPAFLDKDPSVGRTLGRIVWTVLIAAGLALLLAQLAYVYRAQIANQVTFLRPVLERACEPLHCKVPYARQIDTISIMSSSLRSGSAAGDGGAVGEDGKPSDSMVLQATLRNSYDKSQEWPTLVLDLTDFSGTLVVRKNLAPASYLAPDVLDQPFPAGSEVSISVPIALNGLKINGYKLDKFFQ